MIWGKKNAAACSALLPLQPRFWELSFFWKLCLVLNPSIYSVHSTTRRKARVWDMVVDPSIAPD